MTRSEINWNCFRNFFKHFSFLFMTHMDSQFTEKSRFDDNFSGSCSLRQFLKNNWKQDREIETTSNSWKHRNNSRYHFRVGVITWSIYTQLFWHLWSDIKTHSKVSTNFHFRNKLYRYPGVSWVGIVRTYPVDTRSPRTASVWRSTCQKLSRSESVYQVKISIALRSNSFIRPGLKFLSVFHIPRPWSHINKIMLSMRHCIPLFLGDDWTCHPNTKSVRLPS